MGHSLPLFLPNNLTNLLRKQRIPDKFAFGEIQPDMERMTPFLEKAMSRVPRTLEVRIARCNRSMCCSQTGMKKFFCGPESFTPDLAPIVGEVGIRPACLTHQSL